MPSPPAAAGSAAAAPPAPPAAAGAEGAPRRSRRSPGLPGSGFRGFTAAAFGFFAALSAENTHEWFAANAGVYREAVDAPWRALVAAAAEPLAGLLPGLDTNLRAGHVLSRIHMQWPRPGAAYRTGLRAVFAAAGAVRPAAAALFVTLDADGLQAGAENLAGTPEWLAAQAGLTSGEWSASGSRLRWSVAGEPAEPPAVAERMGAVRRRASLRAAERWSASEAADLGPELADAVRGALAAAIPLYLSANGGAALGPGALPAAAAPEGPPGRAAARRPASRRPDRTHPGGAAPAAAREGAPDASRRWPAGRAGGPPGGEEPPPGAEAARPQPAPPPARAAADPARPGGAGALPALPRALCEALSRRARREGVSLETFVVFALTQAAAAP